MALRQEQGIGADLELFTTGVPTRRRKSKGRYSPPWTLGFGPAGGTKPVWGLYRFDRGERVVYERKLLWQSCPSEMDVFRWCSSITCAQVAARLVESVGTFDDFYDSYFSARPDFVDEGELVGPRVRHNPHSPTLTIVAPTAASITHGGGEHRRHVTALASSP